jgi:carbon starvation protein
MVHHCLPTASRPDLAYPVCDHRLRGDFRLAQLVSTSGTARQLEKETDVLPDTAGAMYTEAVLAVLAVITGATLIATTAADGTTTAIYDAAQNYKLIPGAAGVFAGGMSRFMNVLGLDVGVGLAIGSIFLVVMATTVMQLVLRFMRVASAELLGDRMPAFKNPHFGSLVAIALTLFLILVGFWQWLWVMFGSSNQLFAGLALLLITIWLAQQGRRYNWAFIPALFMCATTIAALLYVSIYNHLYVGILTADPAPATPVLIGNLFSFVLGMYMAISAVILFLDALKAFGGARQTGAAAAAAAGD